MTSEWLQLALCRQVVRRALLMALIVAPILVLINQGDYILMGQQLFRVDF